MRAVVIVFYSSRLLSLTALTVRQGCTGRLSKVSMFRMQFYDTTGHNVDGNSRRLAVRGAFANKT